MCCAHGHGFQYSLSDCTSYNLDISLYILGDLKNTVNICFLLQLINIQIIQETQEYSLSMINKLRQLVFTLL